MLGGGLSRVRKYVGGEASIILNAIDSFWSYFCNELRGVGVFDITPVITAITPIPHKVVFPFVTKAS